MDDLEAMLAVKPENGTTMTCSWGTFPVIDSDTAPAGTFYLVANEYVVRGTHIPTRRERLTAWWNRFVGRICRAIVRTAGTTSLGRWM